MTTDAVATGTDRLAGAAPADAAAGGDHVAAAELASLKAAAVKAAARTSALGVFAVLAACACWSSSGVLAKKAALPGTVIAFWRLLIVAVVFGLICAVTRRRITWDMVRRSLPGGMLFGVNLAVWFTALEDASVGIATVTGALTPVMAMVVGNRFLGEKVSGLAMLCAAGAVGGVSLFVVLGFSDEASTTTALGLSLAVLAIAIWVCYLFVTKKAREGVGTIEYLFLMAAIATVSLIPVVLIFADEGLAPPTQGWGWLLGLAIVPGCLGHGLLTWAQPHVDLSVASVLLQGEPVGAAIAGALFLSEKITILQGLGLLIAFAALAVLARQTAATVLIEEAEGPAGA